MTGPAEPVQPPDRRPSHHPPHRMAIARNCLSQLNQRFTAPETAKVEMLLTPEKVESDWSGPQQGSGLRAAGGA